MGAQAGKVQWPHHGHEHHGHHGQAHAQGHPEQKPTEAQSDQSPWDGMITQASFLPLMGLLASGRSGARELLVAAFIPPLMSIAREVSGDVAKDFARKVRQVTEAWVKAPLRALNILDKEAIRVLQKASDGSTDDIAYDAVLRHVLNAAPEGRFAHAPVGIWPFLWRSKRKATGPQQPFAHLRVAKVLCAQKGSRAASQPQLLPEEENWARLYEGEDFWFRHREAQLEIMATGAGCEERVNSFVAEAMQAFDDERKRRMSQERWLFRQQGFSDRYLAYKLTDAKTFDMLFFEKKDEIRSLLQEFEAAAGFYSKEGFPRKLGILLRGPPGTGKTSMVKALALATGRHVVCIDLSKMQTSTKLWKTLIDMEVNTEDKSGCLLTHSNTVFLIEEVDAAGAALQNRKAPRVVQKSLDTSMEDGYESWDDEGGACKSERKEEAVDDKKDAPWAWEWLQGKARDGNDAHGFNMNHQMFMIPENERVQKVQQMAQTMGCACIRVNHDGHCQFQRYSTDDFFAGVRGAHGHERGTWISRGGRASRGSRGPVYDEDFLKTFLEILDGIVETPGRMLVMTTNHPEKLDPALLRPGRVNAGLYMGRLSPNCFRQMLEHYCTPPKIAVPGQRPRYSEEKTLLPEEWEQTWWLATVFYLQPSWVEQECALYYSRKELFAGILHQVEQDDSKRRPINARLLGKIIFHVLGLDVGGIESTTGDNDALPQAIRSHLSSLAQAVKEHAPSAATAHATHLYDLHLPRVHSIVLQTVKDSCKHVQSSGMQGKEMADEIAKNILTSLAKLKEEGVFAHERAPDAEAFAM